MAHKTKQKKAGNARAEKSFESRYGMKRKEFRALTKSDPQKAHALRVSAYHQFITRPAGWGSRLN